MAKRMLADVLWTAANTYLLPDAEDTLAPLSQWYSCNAVQSALCETSGLLSNPKVLRFFDALGCLTHSSSCFFEHRNGEERQGVRYMWLLLAMHVAEDEGIEVDA